MPGLRETASEVWTNAIRELGPRHIAEILSRRAWSDTRAFGLACECAAAPQARRAKVPVAMQPMDGAVGMPHFTAELDRVSGAEYQDVHGRVRDVRQRSAHAVHVAGPGRRRHLRPMAHHARRRGASAGDDPEAVSEPRPA